MKRWTHVLATVMVVGAMALWPAAARAQDHNQFTGIPAFGGEIGPPEIVANVDRFGFPKEGNPLNPVYAYGTFFDGFYPPAVEMWLVEYIGPIVSVPENPIDGVA